MSLTHKQIKVMHVAKRELVLSDEDYKAALLANAGLESSADKGFDIEGFRAVMAHFVRCGFKWREIEKEAMPKKFYDPDEFLEGRLGMATKKQIWLIHNLWWSLKGKYWGQDMTVAEQPVFGKRVLARFLHKRFGVSSMRFLAFRKAGPVIEALKNISHRGHQRALRIKDEDKRKCGEQGVVFN